MNIKPKATPKVVSNKAAQYEFKKYDQFIEVKTGEEMLQRLDMTAGTIAFDTETFAFYKNAHECPANVVRRWVGKGKQASPQDFPFCISICDGKNSYVLYDGPYDNWQEIKKLSGLFADESVAKLAHNIKFDMHMLANIGIEVKGTLHDTVVLAKLTNENRPSFQLRDLAEALPDNKGIVDFEYLVDNYKRSNKVKDYRDIPIELMTQYTCADTWNCWQVFVNEYWHIPAENMESLYNTESELCRILFNIERAGMLVSPEYQEELVVKLSKEKDEAENAIYDAAGKVFNINSSAQLHQVLLEKEPAYTKLQQLTDKGNPKLDKDTLQRLGEVHEIRICKLILDFRQKEKLLTTYAVGIYEQADAENRVHGSINQTEATTGRMSITKPALQTLPKNNKSIRRMFIPEPGYTMAFIDLDQIEYRIFAHYGNAQHLIDRINGGYDIHAAVCVMLFHKNLDELVKLIHDGDEESTKLRSRAKTINFALLYGMGNKALADNLGLSVTEAGEIKKRYFDMIPEIKVFIEQVHKAISQRGYIRNKYNRRRRLKPDECFKGPNALIQGCAADYLKSKLVLVDKYLADKKSYMTNIVHDEVIFQIHNDELDIIPRLKYLLGDPDAFRVAVTAGVDISNKSWGDKIGQPDMEAIAP